MIILPSLLKLQFNESQVSEAKLAETCWTNYPRSEATRDYSMCEFKWYRSLLRNVSKACFGVHTRDSNYCEQLSHKAGCRNVSTTRLSVSHPTNCDKYFIDIQVSLPYTPFSRKQVFIKSRTSTSRLTASGSKVLYHFAFNCIISEKT